MDSANECFSGCARWHNAANMNGRAIPGAYIFGLYVCDKEMSWPHHIGETHQPDWVVYVRLCALVEDKRLNNFKNILKKREVQSTLDRFLTSPLAKRQRPATEEEDTYCTLNKLWKFGRRIVKTLCTYLQFNSIKCIIYFQYNSVKIVSFSFYFPFSFIQLGSCSSQPLLSFCPFIVCSLLFYKTYL